MCPACCPPPICCFSHTHVHPSHHPPKLDFSHIFLVCVCSLVHVWGQGFLCQGELVVRCESPALGSETYLCSVAGPAPITVW